MVLAPIDLKWPVVALSIHDACVVAFCGVSFDIAKVAEIKKISEIAQINGQGGNQRNGENQTKTSHAHQQNLNPIESAFAELTVY